MDDMMNRPPSSYQGWLARLYSSNNNDQIIEAAQNLAALGPDKKKTRLDIAKILSEKYQTDLKRAVNNQMVCNSIKNKYNLLAKNLFGSNIEAMVGYVKSFEES